MERRHGPLVVLALFLGAGVSGGLVAEVLYAEPVVSGANAGALALLAAWAVPDLEAARARALLRRRPAGHGRVRGGAAGAALGGAGRAGWPASRAARWGWSADWAWPA